ncbi:NADPH-dependent F420 reductase (plasmid) [Rhodococcus erythropolis]|uniref:NADPH-dependent F420 reductase n=1 Tax=Rhodococcus erythropolis TaxID=1833 RepID=UPI00406BBACE
MDVGIVGAGKIGATLARKLSAAGHDVLLSNSRGPETIREIATASGAVAKHTEELVRRSQVVIVSVPFSELPRLKPAFSGIDESVAVIDTSNYFPFRDGALEGLADSRTESHWVSAQLGRPVLKAWNSILAGSLAEKGLPGGAHARIALPVAGDGAEGKAIAMMLVDATGFDPIDAGSLDESWRQEPGNPAYCTDLRTGDLELALKQADRKIAIRKRDLVADKVFAARDQYTDEDILDLGRRIYSLTADDPELNP